MTARPDPPRRRRRRYLSPDRPGRRTEPPCLCLLRGRRLMLLCSKFGRREIPDWTDLDSIIDAAQPHFEAEEHSAFFAGARAAARSLCGPARTCPAPEGDAKLAQGSEGWRARSAA